MAGEAYRFILPPLSLSVMFAIIGLYTPGLIFFLLAAFVAYFFRNPQRDIPQGDNLIVSPADGKVVQISSLRSEDGEPTGKAISIFLNIFNVHMNRAPISGKLESLEYKRGRFKAAFAEVASQVNEQNVLTIRGPETRVIMKQIAGLIARRVVCWKRPGHQIERGELIGLIRFGSRVDILLTNEVSVVVKVGDKVKGGSSILGTVPNN